MRKKKKHIVTEILHEGVENAQPRSELCKILECDPRRLTIQIEKERREGEPICATSTGKPMGYYLARDSGEMMAYCRKLDHREGEVHATLLACKKTQRRMAKDEQRQVKSL